MIFVHRISDFQQLNQSLQLRLSCYSGLGFLRPGSRSDLDPFDWSSIHFLAEDDQRAVAGTVRLIIPYPERQFRQEHLRPTESWCDKINEEEQLKISRSLSIPMLDTLKDNEIAQQALAADRPAELSRIIVASGYRNRGVARMLTNAALAEAKKLGRDTMVLQCLPEHVPLFEKLGFEELFQSLEYRHLIVPERVVAMKRFLT